MFSVFAFIDSPFMMLLLGAIAVLLFGERLPEVAKSFGKGLMELKNGVRGLQDEIQNAVNSATSVEPPKRTTTYYGEPEDRKEATATEVRSRPLLLENRRAIMPSMGDEPLWRRSWRFDTLLRPFSREEDWQ